MEDISTNDLLEELQKRVDCVGHVAKPGEEPAGGVLLITGLVDSQKAAEWFSGNYENI